MICQLLTADSDILCVLLCKGIIPSHAYLEWFSEAYSLNGWEESVGALVCNNYYSVFVPGSRSMIIKLGVGVLIKIKYALFVCMLAFFLNGREDPILTVSAYNELVSKMTE